ncbi:MAG: hypothetical protein JAY66_15025 [Candidatus Thiodiazotropha taylori]|nr:hypothetical protein [Candidatus Thiodiazotropha taylori]
MKLTDSGKYACYASNEYGFIWGNTSLKVINHEGKFLIYKLKLTLLLLLTKTSTFSKPLLFGFFLKEAI